MMRYYKRSGSSTLGVLLFLSMIFVVLIMLNSEKLNQQNRSEKQKQNLKTIAQVDNAGYSDKIGTKYPVTKSEYILLCNLLGREYGSDWVEKQEKAKVIETVFNRLKSKEFPNTIKEVITQKGQYTGTLSEYSYSNRVTNSVRETVLEYLNGMYVSHNYLYYWGDGKYNHFYVDYESFRHTYYDVYLPSHS